jgi:hypothetical protein
MKELLRGESTISLEGAVLKCPNAELYLFTFNQLQYIYSVYLLMMGNTCPKHVEVD